MLKRTAVLCLVLASAANAQHRVDPKNTYHRIICVTPLTGSGTAGDPVRPKYAPWPLPALPNRAPAPASRSAQQGGIIAFSYEPSDDGQLAIVEFVARSRSAFQAIFNDSTIQVFEKGKASRATIEAALQKYRKSFSLEQFGTVMP